MTTDNVPMITITQAGRADIKEVSDDTEYQDEHHQQHQRLRIDIPDPDNVPMITITQAGRADIKEVSDDIEYQDEHHQQQQRLRIDIPYPDISQSSSLCSPNDNLQPDQIKQWSGDDVIRWLSNKYLYRFIPIFEENNVNGEILVDSKLEFLEFSNYDITTDEREELLSELYNLLKPNFPQDTMSLKTDDIFKKEKHRAAVELSRTRDFRSRSPSIVLFPSRCYSPMATRKRSPLVKQRSRSESGMSVEDRTAFLEPKSKVKKTTLDLWEIFNSVAPVTVFCRHIRCDDNVDLPKFGFSVKQFENKTMIQRVLDDELGLKEEDLLLEINGTCVHKYKMDINGLLDNTNTVKLVIARQCKQVNPDEEVLEELENVQNQDDKMEIRTEQMMKHEKQKKYLNRLMTSVINKAPWLLAEMDKNIETSLIDTDREEWC